MSMTLVEFPPCNRAASTILVGTNRRGNWVAREQNGTFGGLFMNRAQAFKYALSAAEFCCASTRLRFSMS